MRLLVSVLLTASSVWAATNAADEDLLRKMPLRFEQNARGEWGARSLGFVVGIAADAAAIRLGQETVSVQFADSNPEAPFRGEKRSEISSQYFIAGQYRSADAFLKLRREGIYPGVDAVFYGVGQTLEYDFELAPGADASQIRMRFPGARRVTLLADGSLELALSEGSVIQKAPVTYQRTSPSEVLAVASRYRLEDDGSFSLILGDYDEAHPLVVDPELVLTQYLVGTGADGPVSLQKDAQGLIYVMGYTYSDDFPQVGNTYPNAIITDQEHIFITKINPTPEGAILVYSGYFGGLFGEKLRAAAVDANGIVYMTGLTDDKQFPVTNNAYTKDNGDTRKIFLSALDTRIGGTESLVYSTFFGSNGTTEEPTALALGTTPGTVFIAGYTFSTEFPVKNSIQASRRDRFDAFVAAFDITKSGQDSLIASTYLGGAYDDYPRSIAVDSANRVYVAGYTHSFDFPITGGAYQATNAGGYGDAFISRLRMGTTSSTLEYSTYLGGLGIDRVTKILLDPQGRVAVGGYTDSASFPLTSNAFQKQQKGGGEVFLMILDLQTQVFSQIVQYSTLYGGSDGEYVYDMRIAPNGTYVLGGYTLSRDLPVVDAIRPSSAQGSTDGFVAIIDPREDASRALIYSSYVTGTGEQEVRGLEVDASGTIYVTGTVVGNVFEPGQAVPPPDTNSNVYFFAFRPSPPSVTRQGSRKADSPASGESRRR